MFIVSPQELYDSLRDKVFVAERALLYALDFQFATDLPHTVGGPLGRPKQRGQRKASLLVFHPAACQPCGGRRRARVSSLHVLARPLRSVQHLLTMLSSEPLKGHRERIEARDPKRAYQLKQFPMNFARDRWGLNEVLRWAPLLPVGQGHRCLAAPSGAEVQLASAAPGGMSCAACPRGYGRSTRAVPAPPPIPTPQPAHRGVPAL